ncbi:MAG: tetratricopeptide repeat protein [Spirochaetes bacterium]|nr:tetratricopeptide repeat protein [Spirochaetota bacterium]
MLPLYIGIGVVIVGFIGFIIERFIRREKRWKIQIKLMAQRQDYAGAIDLTKRLINLRPNKVDYYLLLADLYERNKMKASALEVYQNMIKNKIFSNKCREHNIREKIAIINIEDKKIIEAFKELYIIFRTHSQSSYALALLGRIYGSQMKYDKARDYLTKAITLSPHIAEFHYQMGLLWLDTGDLTRAIEELEKSMTQDPNHVKAQYFLALCYRQRGLQEKAKTLFERLNITNLNNLPNNITQIGIMAQNMPKFNIDEIAKSLDEELSGMKKDGRVKVKDVDELLDSGIDVFHETAVSVILKMGYTIKDEIRNRLIDPNTEIDFITIAKKYQDEPQPPLCFIQFNKVRSEVGTIPFADFISKMKDARARSGIFITTSSFSSQIHEKITKENLRITLIDRTKLNRYL